MTIIKNIKIKIYKLVIKYNNLVITIYKLCIIYLNLKFYNSNLKN